MTKFKAITLVVLAAIGIITAGGWVAKKMELI